MAKLRGSKNIPTRGVEHPESHDEALSGDVRQSLQYQPLPRHYDNTNPPSRPFRVPVVNPRYGACADLEMFYPDLYEAQEEKQNQESE